eukprot:SAG31_NODE_2335_length_5925_cov_3.925506_1_plen_108_part_00
MMALNNLGGTRYSSVHAPPLDPSIAAKGAGSSLATSLPCLFRVRRLGLGGRAQGWAGVERAGGAGEAGFGELLPCTKNMRDYQVSVRYIVFFKICAGTENLTLKRFS